MKKIFILSSLILVMIHCNTKKVTVASTQDKLIELTKSPCFGFCPTYELTIYQNGLMKLNAKQNLDKKGIYNKQLDKVSFKKLKTDLTKMNLFQYKDEYKEAVADAPATKIVYHDQDQKKSIFTNFQFPDALEKLSARLDSLVRENGWVEYVDNRKSQEYIIKLKEGKVLHDLIKRFESDELIPVRRLDPTLGQYWVMSAKIEPNGINGFLSRLKKDIDIQEAQLNKEVELRR